MTEREWTECADPIAMLEFLRGSPVAEDSVTWSNNRWQFDEVPAGIDRKFRLFACACCRRIWEQIPEACNRAAVVAVENLLDGRLSGGELDQAFVASSAVEYKEDGSGKRSEPGYWVVKYLGRGFYKMTAAASALLVASSVIFMADPEYGVVARDAFHGCYYTAGGVFLSQFHWPASAPAIVEAEQATQVALISCVFGSPFRRPTIQPSTQDGTVVSLTRAAFDARELPRGELDPARLAILSDALEDAGCDDASMLEHLRSPGPHVRGCWALDLILGKK